MPVKSRTPWFPLAADLLTDFCSRAMVYGFSFKGGVDGATIVTRLGGVDSFKLSSISINNLNQRQFRILPASFVFNFFVALTCDPLVFIRLEFSLLFSVGFSRDLNLSGLSLSRMLLLLLLIRVVFNYSSIPCFFFLLAFSKSSFNFSFYNERRVACSWRVSIWIFISCSICVIAYLQQCVALSQLITSEVNAHTDHTHFPPS